MTPSRPDLLAGPGPGAGGREADAGLQGTAVPTGRALARRFVLVVALAAGLSWSVAATTDQVEGTLVALEQLRRIGSRTAQAASLGARDMLAAGLVPVGLGVREGGFVDGWGNPLVLARDGGALVARLGGPAGPHKAECERLLARLAQQGLEGFAVRSGPGHAAARPQEEPNDPRRCPATAAVLQVRLASR